MPATAICLRRSSPRVCTVVCECLHVHCYASVQWYGSTTLGVKRLAVRSMLLKDTYDTPLARDHMTIFDLQHNVRQAVGKNSVYLASSQSGVSVLKLDKSVISCDRLSSYITMHSCGLLFPSLARGMS